MTSFLANAAPVVLSFAFVVLFVWALERANRRGAGAPWRNDFVHQVDDDADARRAVHDLPDRRGFPRHSRHA